MDKNFGITEDDVEKFRDKVFDGGLEICWIYFHSPSRTVAKELSKKLNALGIAARIDDDIPFIYRNNGIPRSLALSRMTIAQNHGVAVFLIDKTYFSQSEDYQNDPTDVFVTLCEEHEKDKTKFGIIPVWHETYPAEVSVPSKLRKHAALKRSFEYVRGMGGMMDFDSESVGQSAPQIVEFARDLQQNKRDKQEDKRKKKDEERFDHISSSLANSEMYVIRKSVQLKIADILAKRLGDGPKLYMVTVQFDGLDRGSLMAELYNGCPPSVITTEFMRQLDEWGTPVRELLYALKKVNYTHVHNEIVDALKQN